MSASGEAARARQPGIGTNTSTKQVDSQATVPVSLGGPPLTVALRLRPQEFANIDGLSIPPDASKYPAEQRRWGGLKSYLRDAVAVPGSERSLVSNLHILGDDFPTQYLARTPPTWATEHGFPTCDPETRSEHHNCVAPRERAAFYARGMIIGFSNSVLLRSIYLVTDVVTGEKLNIAITQRSRFDDN